jgi:hypothetical protein
MIGRRDPDPNTSTLLRYVHRAPALIRETVSDILDQEAQVCLVDSLPGGLHQQTVARTQMQCEEARQSGRLYRYRIGKGRKEKHGWLAQESWRVRHSVSQLSVSGRSKGK